jgi:hypothetical protein
MKYLYHVEFEIDDPRIDEVRALLEKLDLFWSEEEIDEDGFQVN